MSYNANESFNQALEIFSSLYQDMAPTDLPPGLSPDCQDVMFLPGNVFTRFGMNKFLAAPPEPASDVNSLAEFPLVNGDYLSMFLYSSGNFYQEDLGTGLVTQIGSVTAGSQFKKATAFNKQFYAFYNPLINPPLSNLPFPGTDVPLYYDGAALWRLTTDAPGVNPMFVNVPTLPVTIQQSAPTATLSVSAVQSTGQYIVQETLPNQPTQTVTYYLTVTYTCTTAPSVSLVGLQVSVTGCTGTNASLVNATGTIIAVSGNTFTIQYSTGTVNVNLAGQAGTATVSGNFFSRTGNIVTAYLTGGVVPPYFQAGLYAKIMYQNGAAINGPNWTIDAAGGIARDATGLVTVTIDAQLSNLASGTQLFINASDATDFPPSLQTVYQVLSATGGKTVFTISNPTWGNGAVVSSNAGGSVYQVWSGTFQIQSLGVDSNGNIFIKYFQLGPDTPLNTLTATAVAQLQSQMTPGPRNAVIMFKSLNGAITAPSIPVQLAASGGSNLLSAQQIPIGPAGTAQRIIAFTPAYGSSYYYVAPAIVPSINGLPPVLSIGTIIPDNITTNATIDFSDTQLTASEGATQIDIDGNNLFNQVVLAPCLGCFEYEERIGWFGEINNIKNLVNPGFDGGYVAQAGVVNTNGTSVTWVSGNQFSQFAGGSQIAINGVLYTVQTWNSATSLTLTTNAGVQNGVAFTLLLVSNPSASIPGWSQAGSTGGSPYLTQLAQNSFGVVMPTNFAGTNDSMLSQAGYQDFFGEPILQPNTQYLLRLKINVHSDFALGGNFVCDFYSPSKGQILAQASIAVTNLTGSFQWVVAAFNVQTPVAIPQDTLIRIYLSHVLNDAIVAIDDFMLINAQYPVNNQQIRFSYDENEFGYDSQTGIAQMTGKQKITGAFKQRGYFYALTDGPLWQGQNNGQTEPNKWPFKSYADECDCFGPNAVVETEDLAWWAGAQSGVRVFNGTKPNKISQEWQKIFETINNNVPLSVWLANDSEERLLLCGIPTGVNTKPNEVLHMNYRNVGDPANDPAPLRQSLSGKMIPLELCRKWAPWNMQVSCGEVMMQTSTVGNERQLFLGGQGHGNFYWLNPLKFHDDDYGVISSYYTTCFFFNHETEQMAPGLGQHRKLFKFLSLYVSGIGQIEITPLVDSLTNPFVITPTVWNSLINQWSAGGPGTYSSFCNTNGTALTVLSGTLPAGITQVIINGVYYNVVSQGLGTLTLASSAGVQANVTFTALYIPAAPPALNVYSLTPNPTFDLEWSDMNVPGERMALKIQVIPQQGQLDAAFNLQHLTIAGSADKVFPIRGAIK